MRFLFIFFLSTFSLFAEGPQWPYFVKEGSSPWTLKAKPSPENFSNLESLEVQSFRFPYIFKGKLEEIDKDYQDNIWSYQTLIFEFNLGSEEKVSDLLDTHKINLPEWVSSTSITLKQAKELIKTYKDIRAAADTEGVKYYADLQANLFKKAKEIKAHIVSEHAEALLESSKLIKTLETFLAQLKKHDKHISDLGPKKIQGVKIQKKIGKLPFGKALKAHQTLRGRHRNLASRDEKLGKARKKTEKLSTHYVAETSADAEQDSDDDDSDEEETL